jgi:hypothetical protein
MNVSGSRAAEDINLDEFERRLRAAGAQQPSAEDPLLELSRLIESSRFGASDSGPPARAAVESAGAQAKPGPSIETAALRPAIEEAGDLDFVPAASEADREARQDYESPTHSSHDAHPAEQAAEARPKGWKLKVSALALAGVAMIGIVFALKGGASSLSRNPPFIAAAQGPTKVQPPSDETVTASTGGSLLQDNAKPGFVKVINSEEQPVDLSAEASIGNASAARANPPAAADLAKSPAGGLAVTPVAASVDTPLVPQPLAAAPAPMTSEFPNPKPVRTVSLRPDGTPIAAQNPLDQNAMATIPAAASAEASGKLAPKAASDAAGVAQPSTPKLDLPAKLPPKSSARVVVAKTDTTAPDATAQPPRAPAQLAAPVKAPKKPKPEQAQAEATETPTASAAPPVDATAATASGGWAVQVAAPKSEAEASSDMARLTSKYSADLNGSALGVHKAVVNGETVYRLRVVGLTKADAAALCARLKGDGGACFIAK